MTRYPAVIIALLSAVLVLPGWVYSTSITQATPEDQAPNNAKKDEKRSTEVVRLDSSLVLTPGTRHGAFADPFKKNTARPLSMYLATDAERFLGLQRFELTRFQSAIYGADVGLTYGMILGAAGMMSGAFDEREAWYLAGAAAALGALFTSTVKHDDPGFRIRLRWDPSQFEER